jgi:hypothetical protein
VQKGYFTKICCFSNLVCLISILLLTACGTEPEKKTSVVENPTYSPRNFISPLATYVKELKAIRKNKIAKSTLTYSRTSKRESTDSILAKADQYLRRGNPREAILLLTTYANKPDLPPQKRSEFQFMLGQALAQTGNQQEAQRSWQKMEENLKNARELADESEAKERFGGLLLVDQFKKKEGEDPEQFFRDYIQP